MTWLFLLGLTSPVAAQEAPLPSDAGTAERPEREAVAKHSPPSSAARQPGRKPAKGREPHYFRAALEELGALGIGTAWYWIDRDRNVADWDDDAIGQRLTLDAIRFDNNPLEVNFVGHMLAGSGYYGLGRVNGLGVGTSFGYAFATSFLWEYAFEFREKVSLADLVVTPGAGLVTGEFLVQLSRYLNSAPRRNTPIQELLSWTVGSAVRLHDEWDGIAGEREADTPIDALGYDARLWHEFVLGASASLGGPARSPEEGTAPAGETPLGLRARGRFVDLPGYRAPRALTRSFNQANVSGVVVDLRHGSRHTLVDVAAEVLLLGHHHQAVAASRAGLAGHSVTVAIGTGYHYRKEIAPRFRDVQGRFTLPGPALDASARLGPFSISTELRLNLGLAEIKSLAYPRWREDHPDLRTKGVLQKQGYHNALGWSERARVELGVGRLFAGAESRQGHYDSIEGLDRHQEEIDVDLEAEDRFFELDLWVKLALEPVVLGYTYESRKKSSRAGDFTVDASRTLHVLSLDFVF